MVFVTNLKFKTQVSQLISLLSNYESQLIASEHLHILDA